MFFLNPYKVLLILGNGFDLSLGLKTSYANFIESDLFQKKVAIKHYPNVKIDLHDKNIHNYLTHQKRMKNWIDVEMELKKYASQQRVEYHNDRGGLTSTQNASDGQIRMSYDILCMDLQTYMKSLDYSSVNMNAPSLQLLQIILAKKRNDVVTFNYTDVTRLISRPRGSIEFMHGNINEGIILGFQRFENMAPGYEYMIKAENPIYKSRHLYAKMLEADEVIIFGHSLGETDHCYFKPFFEEQTKCNASPRRLTVFTRDRESRNTITQQMVSLSEGKYQVFQDNTDVNVIETANNEKGVTEYVDELKKRMRFHLV